jgi:hypothetical protein
MRYMSRGTRWISGIDEDARVAKPPLIMYTCGLCQCVQGSPLGTAGQYKCTKHSFGLVCKSLGQPWRLVFASTVVGSLPA